MEYFTDTNPIFSPYLSSLLPKVQQWTVAIMAMHLMIDSLFAALLPLLWWYCTIVDALSRPRSEYRMTSDENRIPNDYNRIPNGYKRMPNGYNRIPNGYNNDTISFDTAINIRQEPREYPLRIFASWTGQHFSVVLVVRNATMHCLLLVAPRTNHGVRTPTTPLSALSERAWPALASPAEQHTRG